MSELTVPQHLLDLDTGSIDTSFPVLRGAMYDLVVASSEIGKSNDGGPLWVIKLNTIREAKGVKGEDIPKATLFHRVSLNPTDKYDGEAIVKNACRFMQACKPPVSLKVADFVNAVNKGEAGPMVKLFEGRQVTAKVEALPEGFDKKSNRNLPARNEISQFEKVK